MTLFVTTPSRQRVFEIDDFYVMTVTLLLFFVIGKMIKAALRRQEAEKRKKKVPSPNLRGGHNLAIDDTELMSVMLSCVSDNERYLVKDAAIRQMIFDVVKAKIQNESLVLAPNLFRFLALHLMSKNQQQTKVVQFMNFAVSASNQVRFVTRVVGAAIIGLISGVVATLPQAVVLMVLYYNLSQDCNYKCEEYFEHLPKEGPVTIYAEKSVGQLVIAENNDARQVEIYVPSKAQSSRIESIKADKEIEKTKTSRIYKKSRTKAKLVKFSEFRKTDPALATFNNLEEPIVEQRKCSLSEKDRITGLE